MPKIYGSSEIWGDLLVTGSFSILGSASSIFTTSLVVSDTIISLGHSQSGSPLLDEGIMFTRGTGLTQAFIWDETNDTFALIGTNDDHTIVGSVNIDSYSNLRVGGLTTSTIKITDGASSGYVLQSDSLGNGSWVQLPTGLSGAGSASYIPKWSSSTGLTNSLIYDNGSTICIGQTTSSTDTLLYLRESSSSIKTGIYTEVISSSSFNVGISSNVGSGLGFGSGDYAVVGNIGASTASDSYSIYARNVGSSTNKYAIYNIVTGNGSSTTNYGSYNSVSGANTNNYGVYNIISGTYGSKYGVYTVISGQGSNYGQFTSLSSTGSSNYGLYISSSGATNNWGVFVNSGTNVFNNSAGDFDFQIKGDTEDFLFYLDASTDRIGMGTASPAYRLHVIGTVSTTGFRMTNGASDGYILTSDSSGNATWTASTSYKSYVGLLTQTSSNAPTATELENTFGISATFSYDSSGFYRLYMSGQFTSSKTVVFIGSPDQGGIGGDFGHFVAVRQDLNTIYLQTFDVSGSATPTDNLLLNTPIEIRVYP